MTLVTSFFRRRFIAKTLIVGGLASCPLVLSSEITLAQQWSNYNELQCLYVGNKEPYVFASTLWSKAPANSTVGVQVTLFRYSLPVRDFVPIASDGNIASGASGEVSAIAKSPVPYGYFQGDSFFNSTFFPDVNRTRKILCLP